MANTENEWNEENQKNKALESIAEIALLCKGWYDKQKYGILDALTAYYEDRFQLSLKDATDAYKRKFLSDVLLDSYAVRLILMYLPDRRLTFANHVMEWLNAESPNMDKFAVLNSFLSNLQMRGRNLEEIPTEKWLMTNPDTRMIVQKRDIITGELIASAYHGTKTE